MAEKEVENLCVCVWWEESTRMFKKEIHQKTVKKVRMKAKGFYRLTFFMLC